MKVEFERAKVIVDGEDAFLCLHIPYRDARKFVGEMKPKKYVAEIKEWRARRSLDANAYFWVLLDKLAEVTGEPKTELYRSYVREIGGNNYVVCAKDEVVDFLRKGWEREGLGWITDTLPSKLEGCTKVIFYYGSSTYDTHQMSRLIEMAVADCKEQGIETLTPAELARLTSEWKPKQ